MSGVGGVRLGRGFAYVVLGVGALLCSGCSLFFGGDSYHFVNYTVRPGDTVYSIGMRYNVPTDVIIDENDIDEPRELQIGTVLRIPVREGGVRPPQAVAGQPPPKLARKRDPGSVQTVKLAGARLLVGKLVWPVRGGTISSEFGRRWLSFHEGIDIRAIEGTTIYAAHEGQVVYSGDGLRGYGNLVVIQSESLATVYGHNERNLVEVGEYVKRGDKIARVGQTGKASAPHLHFETRVRDNSGKLVAVDPLVFYPGEA